MILTLCHIEKQNKKSTGLFLLVETLGKETQQEEVSNHMGPEGIFSQPPSLPHLPLQSPFATASHLQDVLPEHLGKGMGINLQELKLTSLFL